MKENLSNLFWEQKCRKEPKSSTSILQILTRRARGHHLRKPVRSHKKIPPHPLSFIHEHNFNSGFHSVHSKETFATCFVLVAWLVLHIWHPNEKTKYIRRFPEHLRCLFSHFPLIWYARDGWRKEANSGLISSSTNEGIKYHQIVIRVTGPAALLRVVLSPKNPEL